MAESIIPLKPNKQRDWESMKDKEVLDFARRLIEEKGVKNRKGLAKADYGLYQVLKRRKLLNKVKFEERREQREWGADEEVLDTARRFIEENGVTNRSGLEKADLGLYQVLKRRKLLHTVDFEAGKRTWGSDEEVLNTARRFIEENGITNRSGLEKADLGLYQVLKRRKLLDRAFSQMDHASHRRAVQGVLDAMDSFGDER